MDTLVTSLGKTPVAEPLALAEGVAVDYVNLACPP
jgi:hypothetical protein